MAVSQKDNGNISESGYVKVESLSDEFRNLSSVKEGNEAEKIAAH
jgi:hypothetical protein